MSVRAAKLELIADALVSKYFLFVLLMLGFLGASFYMVIDNPYVIVYPSALILAVMLYLILQQFRLSELSLVKGPQIGIYPVLFCLTLSFTIFLYHSTGFSRNKIIFLFLFVQVILTGLMIYSGCSVKLGIAAILVTGITLRLTGFYGSALFVGVDVYSHVGRASSLAESGSLAILSDSKYYYAPYYHILGATTQMIIDASIKDSVGWTIPLLTTLIPLIVVFSISSRYWSSKVSLFAALLFVVADYAVYWGIHTSTASLGVVFFSLIIFSAYRYVVSGGFKQFALMSIFLLSLKFTHQNSLFIGGVVILLIMSSRIVTMKQYRRVIPTFLIVFIAIFIDFDTTKYHGREGQTTFLDSIIIQLIRAIIEAGVDTRPEIAHSEWANVYPTGTASWGVVHVVGSGLLLSFAILGSLLWIYHSNTDEELSTAITFSMTAGGMIIITLIGPLFGADVLLPRRWFAFNYLFLSLLAAPAIFMTLQYLSNIPSPTSRLVHIIFLLLFVPYVVFMGGAIVASVDQPVFDNSPGAERLSLTEQERSMLEHALHHDSNDVELLGDHRMLSALPLFETRASTSTITLDMNDPRTMVSEESELILSREYMKTRHVQYYIRGDDSAWRVRGPINTHEIPSTKASKVYDVGTSHLIYSD